MGLYYQAIGDIEKAKEHLFVTAMSPYDNYFKQEAHHLYNRLTSNYPYSQD
jgi:TolA-binding protein